MKKKNQAILSILGVIALVIVTAGVSYAFFTYAKEGSTENTIRTGTITFLYTEDSTVGNGINIQDALPMSDAQGKIQTGVGNIFDFSVTGQTMSTASVTYEIDAVKQASSTLPENIIKLFLVEVNGTEVINGAGNLTGTDGKLFSNLVATNTPGASGSKVYGDTIAAGTASYQKNFRLRMWIDENADFSPAAGSTTGEGKYNGQSFSIKVNVYANAQVISAPTT